MSTVALTTENLLPSANDSFREVALAEAADARKQDKGELEKKKLLQQFSKPSGVSDDERLKRAAAIIKRAVRNKMTEVEIGRFPNQLCTDRGRAIIQAEPGWEDTLTGLPKELHEFWQKHMRHGTSFAPTTSAAPASTASRTSLLQSHTSTWVKAASACRSVRTTGDTTTARRCAGSISSPAATDAVHLCRSSSQPIPSSAVRSRTFAGSPGWTSRAARTTNPDRLLQRQEVTCMPTGQSKIRTSGG